MIHRERTHEAFAQVLAEELLVLQAARWISTGDDRAMDLARTTQWMDLLRNVDDNSRRREVFSRARELLMNDDEPEVREAAKVIFA
jgi:hypothetical protein